MSCNATPLSGRFGPVRKRYTYGPDVEYPAIDTDSPSDAWIPLDATALPVMNSRTAMNRVVSRVLSRETICSGWY
jgi:hypothetical protein